MAFWDVSAMVNVFITIDVENSIGGAFKNPQNKPVGSERRVYGKIGSKYYGIPLIIDIAERYGLRLVFFLEVMCRHYFGDTEMGGVCEYIMKRGHDVQLHLHPGFLNFTLNNPMDKTFSDRIGHYDADRQLEFITQGKETLLKYGVKNPVAFRAGSYAGNMDTIAALKKAGFLIDSSYNGAYIGRTCLFPHMRVNDQFEINGISEFPITNFIENIPFRKKRLKPLDINGVSVKEMKWVLRRAKRIGLQNITIILHSFSFIKSYDDQFRKVRVRKGVIQRFEWLCRFLSENPTTFNVCVFGHLPEHPASNETISQSCHFDRVPFALSLHRGFEQLCDDVI